MDVLEGAIEHAIGRVDPGAEEHEGVADDQLLARVLNFLLNSSLLCSTESDRYHATEANRHSEKFYR